ncbi:hypothetical protein CN378_03190 [Bacillus sp. AFS015802]|uniref:hypothetical protein n=1 Tax=Bacillus sp. AFS015802 TaxID=2033486 RepID=UPI000BFA7B58|nr:hypothetical protein [Bacillus sp. AFS015802]PFA69786.1 hypothetical protein CN378_03190 [Bacillus sp. AFS015802]
MKRFILFMFLISFGGIVIGCSQSDEKPNYTSLSKTEIEQFIEEKSIEPLAIEEVQDSTMVLYEGGIYYLSKNEDETIVNRTGWGGNSKGKVQLGMTSTGSPHAYVIVQDEKLLNKAEKATVKFSDGNTATKQFSSTKGMLMFYDKSKSNLTISNELELSIYDKEGKVIYKNKL